MISSSPCFYLKHINLSFEQHKTQNESQTKKSTDTERTHYLAYKHAAAARGVDIDWSFEAYCLRAHFGEDGLNDHLYKSFPQLKVNF